MTEYEGVQGDLGLSSAGSSQPGLNVIVAAVNIAVDDPLPDVPMAHAVAVVPQEDEMPVLTVSSSSVDDIAPQASRDTCNTYYFLTLLPSCS